MPTYEYHCDSCEREFEVDQRITDDPSSECPECGGKAHRLISASNFILKGSGWYKTDYCSSSGPPPSKPAGCAAETSDPKCKSCPAGTK